MSQKPKEKHFERINTKGQHVEVIEETLPGKKEEYGKMVKRTENHNLYESGSHNLPGEKRYREILLEQEKKKKEKQNKKEEKVTKSKSVEKTTISIKKCICGLDHEKLKCTCGMDHQGLVCTCGMDHAQELVCTCGIDHEEEQRKMMEMELKKRQEEERRRREAEAKRRKEEEEKER